MPLYEYVCQSCKRQFEQLRPMADGQKAGCPQCGGDAARVLSVFASFSRTENGEMTPVGGGGCACSGAGCGCSLS